jgi:hypothetical protein
MIRFALNINDSIAQVEVSGAQSEAIRRILRGIVVHVRDIRVYMNRTRFIINPTNCSPMGITDTIDGAGADLTNPADQQPVSVNTPFDAADGASLAFKPSFTASVTGKASEAAGAGLKVNIAFPNTPQGSKANIHSVKVELPIQLPSRLTTLQKKGITSSTFHQVPDQPVTSFELTLPQGPYSALPRTRTCARPSRP